MKKIFKKLISLLLAPVILSSCICLAGCGSNGAGDSSEATNSVPKVFCGYADKDAGSPVLYSIDDNGEPNIIFKSKFAAGVQEHVQQGEWIWFIENCAKKAVIDTEEYLGRTRVEIDCAPKQISKIKIDGTGYEVVKKFKKRNHLYGFTVDGGYVYYNFAKSCFECDWDNAFDGDAVELRAYDLDSGTEKVIAKDDWYVHYEAQNNKAYVISSKYDDANARYAGEAEYLGEDVKMYDMSTAGDATTAAPQNMTEDFFDLIKQTWNWAINDYFLQIEGVDVYYLDSEKNFCKRKFGDKENKEVFFCLKESEDTEFIRSITLRDGYVYYIRLHEKCDSDAFDGGRMVSSLIRRKLEKDAPAEYIYTTQEECKNLLYWILDNYYMVAEVEKIDYRDMVRSSSDTASLTFGKTSPATLVRVSKEDLSTAIVKKRYDSRYGVEVDGDFLVTTYFKKKKLYIDVENVTEMPALEIETKTYKYPDEESAYEYCMQVLREKYPEVDWSQFEFSLSYSLNDGVEGWQIFADLPDESKKLLDIEKYDYIPVIGASVCFRRMDGKIIRSGLTDKKLLNQWVELQKK